MDNKRTPSKRSNERKVAGQHKLIGEITTPLKFFALTLLTGEAIVGEVIVRSKLSADQQFQVIIWMLILIAVMVAAVVALAFLRPRHLSPEMANALTTISDYVETDVFRDIVLDIVDSRLKLPEHSGRKGDTGGRPGSN